MFKFKTLLKILIFQLILMLFPFKSKLVFSSPDKDAPFNILVINSYNAENEWEHLVNSGLREKLSDYSNIVYNLEFLDSKTQFSDEYKKSFVNLLNLKYKASEINAVLTIDDEAFELVRENIFNEDSIFYKKPTVFIGTNNEIILSDEEKKFITGVIEIEDNLRFLNLLLDLQKDIEEVFILLDNSTFSDIIKKNIISIENLTKKHIKINFIEEVYIGDILPKLYDIDSKKSALILVGEFKNKEDDLYINLSDTITLIKDATNSPIYTKVEPYIYAGSIGGIVDIGNYHGSVAGELFIKLLSGIPIEYIPLIYNTLDITMFNYDSLYYYNINPLLLPNDSVLINKGIFDFLLPTPLKIIVWAIITLIFLSLILIVIYSLKRRKAALLRELEYKKAIEGEKLKSNFIATMSHEFRTPINIILSTSHLLSLKLSDEVIDKDDFTTKLGYITKNSNRLLKLINNIIDVTRLESGFLKPDFTFNNIVSTVEDTVLSVVDLAKNFDIEIIFDTEEEEIYTMYDINQIERCVLNLLSNSIKFTPNGGSIYVNIKANTNEVIIEIKDTGIGIPKDQIENIFDRFHQVNSSFCRHTEGSGLGLYIVKNLIQLHNGKIIVDSTYGKGTTFTIYLPIILSSHYENTPSSLHSDLSRQVMIELSDLIENN